jgi:aminoglycoside phosphotransferase (APT) family kinase protein
MDLLKGPLEAYAAHRFGAGTQVKSASTFTRGSSRVTWFVDLVDPAGDLRPLIFRADPPGGSTIPTSLEQEHFVYERLGRTDVPVPRTLFWEDDPAWAARPFYVREQVDGHWDVPGFSDPDPSHDDLRIAISKEHMRKLALVHAVDWKAAGLDERISVPPDAAGCAAHFIDAMVADAAAYSDAVPPILVEGIVWLKKRAPIAPGLHLCKGTNGLGEEVFRDGVIVAMCDWEEVSIGDPAADFAYLQNFAPEIERDGRTLWGMEAALDYYRSVGGADVTMEAVRFYQIVRGLSSLLMGQTAAAIVHRGNGTIRQAWTGTEVVHLGKRMLAATMGLAPPIDPAWFGENNESIR